MTLLTWDDEWSPARPARKDGMLGRREMQGDRREATYVQLAENLRDAVFRFLAEHDRTLAPKEQDGRIRTDFIRPAIAEYNRRAALEDDERLPARAEDEVFNRLRGFGPLQQFYDDRTGITEVMCDGPGQVLYFERDGLYHDTDIRLSEEDIALTVERLQGLGGVGLGYNNPTVELNLPRARIIAHDKTFIRSGPTICMRIRRANPFTGQDMVEAAVLPQEILLLLARALEAGANIVICGGMSTYKTTLAQSLIDLLPDWHRIITIEDPVEFSLRRRRLLQMEVRADVGLTPRECLRQSLRNNATNIVLGEVRDGAALDLVDAMIIGQGGTLCTLHASTPLDGLRRLEGLCMYTDEHVPIEAIRTKIVQAVNLVVVLRKQVVRSGGERRVRRMLTHVSELTGATATGDYELTDIVRWEGGRLCDTGNGLSEGLEQMFADSDLEVPDYSAVLEPTGKAARYVRRPGGAGPGMGEERHGW